MKIKNLNYCNVIRTQLFVDYEMNINEAKAFMDKFTEVADGLTINCKESVYDYCINGDWGNISAGDRNKKAEWKIIESH